MSHTTGKLHGSPYLNKADTDDFGDRMQRIKASLEKINSLMSELKAKVRVTTSSFETYNI